MYLWVSFTVAIHRSLVVETRVGGGASRFPCQKTCHYRRHELVPYLVASSQVGISAAFGDLSWVAARAKGWWEPVQGNRQCQVQTKWSHEQQRAAGDLSAAVPPPGRDDARRDLVAYPIAPARGEEPFHGECVFSSVALSGMWRGENLIYRSQSRKDIGRRGEQGKDRVGNSKSGGK